MEIGHRAAWHRRIRPAFADNTGQTAPDRGVVVEHGRTYKRAADVLSNCKLKPKYRVSNATIKEAEFQVDTIFRRAIGAYPTPGVDSSDSCFSCTDEGVMRTRACTDRLYLWMATTKSAVALPLKAQSIAMG